MLSSVRSAPVTALDEPPRIVRRGDEARRLNHAAALEACREPGARGARDLMRRAVRRDCYQCATRRAGREIAPQKRLHDPRIRAGIRLGVDRAADLAHTVSADRDLLIGADCLAAIGVLRYVDGRLDAIEIDPAGRDHRRERDLFVDCEFLECSRCEGHDSCSC
jgi:hypothetical protein